MESRPARLDDALDRATAAGPLARFALPVVDLEAMLEIAERTVGLPMIAQARSAGLDCLADHVAYRLCQPVAALGRPAIQFDDGTGQPFGRKPGLPQRLAGIDIADPRDQPLVEEGGFQRRRLAREQLRDCLPVEPVAGRFDAEAGKARIVGKMIGRDQVHEAEASRVIISDGETPSRIFEVEDDMIVRGQLAARHVEHARRVRLVFGVRHESDLFYTDLLRGLSAHYPAFEHHITLSQASEGRWAGHRGRVTTLVDELVTPADARTTEVYLCGSMGMIQSSERILLDKGFEPEHIRYENFY